MTTYEDMNGDYQEGPGVAPLQSLSSVSAVGPGAVLDGGVCRANHVMAVTTSAGVTAGVVQLQGSLDDTNWFNLPGTSSITTSQANTTSVVSVAAVTRFLRAAVTAGITGGTISAMIGSSG